MEIKNMQKPANSADGGKKEKKKVTFPCNLCHEYHLTHLCPLMEQDQKLSKSQQPANLKDPFPQGQNYASTSNAAGGTPNTPDPNYINMVQSQTLLQTKNKNYEKEISEKGKSIGETSNPLTIEKPAEIMPKILKGVFKKTLHNHNARAATNYSIFEDLA